MFGLKAAVTAAGCCAAHWGTTFAVVVAARGYWACDPAHGPTNRIVCWVFPDGTVAW